MISETDVWDVLHWRHRKITDGEGLGKYGRRKKYIKGTGGLADLYIGHHRTDVSDHHIRRTEDEGKRALYGDDAFRWG